MVDEGTSVSPLTENTNTGGFFSLAMLLFFSITAAFAVWAGAFYMGISPKIEHIITCAFIIFGIYGINRYTDLEDFLNDPCKRLFFISHKKYFFISIMLLSLSVFWLLATGTLTVYHVLCIYTGIAYSVPLFPWIIRKCSIKWVRFKEITFVKSFSVSLIVGSSFFALYFMNKNIIASRIEIIALMIGSILSVFINTVFCDIRDVVGDKAAGIKTIPVVMNVRRTVIYILALPSLVWVTLLSVLFDFSLISLSTFIFSLAIIVYPVIYISLYFTRIIPLKVNFLIADSCVAVYALGLIYLRLLNS